MNNTNSPSCLNCHHMSVQLGPVGNQQKECSFLSHIFSETNMVFPHFYLIEYNPSISIKFLKWFTFPFPCLLLVSNLKYSTTLSLPFNSHYYHQPITNYIGRGAFLPKCNPPPSSPYIYIVLASTPHWDNFFLIVGVNIWEDL